MIGALIRRRREARAAYAETIRTAVDHLVRFNGDDLDRTFWRAHDRWVLTDQSVADRRYWGDVLDEIDRRRSPRASRADTATRMLFRNPRH